MQSPEFQEILASVQSIVSDAYALGRSDALKRVVEALKADAPSPKPLALMSPAEDTNKTMPRTVQDNDNGLPRMETPDAAETGGHASGDAEQVGMVPWWSRPPRRA